MNGKLKIDLDKRTDRDGKIFYVGKISAPILIDCEKSVSFLVFVSEDGAEQLQICNTDRAKSGAKKSPKIYKQIKKEI